MPSILAPKYKDKLPGYLSYPLLSSDISTSIAIHANKYPLEYCFWNYHAPKQNHKDSLPYEVCTLRFSIRLPTENHDGGSLWELDIRPVLRTHKKIISDLLSNEGFPKLETWLTAPRTPLWLSTPGHSLKLKYLPENQSLIITERS